MSKKTTAVEFDEKKIDAIFAEINQCHLPGAAVAIAIGGRPVYRKAFGLASLELPIVLTTSTRIRLGSTSKHLTCFTYMLLCEEGKVGVDDPIGKFVPELHPVGRKVTMRQLMENTSGLRDVYDLHFHSSGMGSAVSTGELLSLYRDIDDVNFEPGTNWCYNNANWLLLTVAIERITGQSLERVMWERVFAPIGMYDSMVRRVDTDFQANSATQHSTAPPASGFVRKSWGAENFVGAGAVVSTADDMLRWLVHMDAPTVGNGATWAMMKSPRILPNGASTSYALGLILGNYRGVETLSHGGNPLGGSAQILKVPAAGLDVAIITNRQDIPHSIWLSHKVMDACLPQLEPVQAPVQQGEGGPSITAVFCSPNTGRVVELYVKDGQQMVSVNSQFDMAVLRGNDGLLRPLWGADTGEAVTLLGGPTKPTGIYFDQHGSRDELFAVPPRVSGNASSTVGRYRHEPTGLEATISGSTEEPQLQLMGRFGSIGYELQSLADGIWRARRPKSVNLQEHQWTWPGGTLWFDTAGQGFRFSNMATWGLRFKRCS